MEGSPPASAGQTQGTGETGLIQKVAAESNLRPALVFLPLSPWPQTVDQYQEREATKSHAGSSMAESCEVSINGDVNENAPFKGP